MTEPVESVERFRGRARAWVERHVPPRGSWPGGVGSVPPALGLQQQIFDAGFAAITWPTRYGGQDLTPAHLHAFSEALQGYEDPALTLSVSIGVIGPTLLEFGTDEQKAEHLPGLLRGDTLWVQYLSEPSGGSDMAGVLTRATRDGDEWILDGSKVWTTFGDRADYGLCLARTDWDAPKHAGLSMFIVPVATPGVTVVPLPQASGASEFCQEYLDGVRLPADALLGAEGQGWAVASQLLVNERNALGGGSRWFSPPAGGDAESGGARDLARLAARAGRGGDPLARQLVAETHAAAVVGDQLAARVATGMRTGHFPAAAGSLLKLYAADLHLDRVAAAAELLGPDLAGWTTDADTEGSAGPAAMAWLTRQGTSIMGGTNEIQRNIISERVLGLPREPGPPKDVPFRQVRTNAGPNPGGAPWTSN